MRSLARRMPVCVLLGFTARLRRSAGAKSKVRSDEARMWLRKFANPMLARRLACMRVLRVTKRVFKWRKIRIPPRDGANNRDTGSAYTVLRGDDGRDPPPFPHGRVVPLPRALAKRAEPRPDATCAEGCQRLRLPVLDLEQT